MARSRWLKSLRRSCRRFFRRTPKNDSNIQNEKDEDIIKAEEVADTNKKERKENKPNVAPLQKSSTPNTSQPNGSHQQHNNTQKDQLPNILINRPTGLESNAQENGEIAIPSPIGTLTPSHSDASLRIRSQSIGEHELRDLLEREEKECYARRQERIIPRSRLEALVTVPVVRKDILARNPDIPHTTAHDYAERVCEPAKPAKKLYAVLTYVKKGADIGALLKEGVCDEDLPLVIRTGPRVEVKRKNGETVETLLTWKERRLKDFDRHQFTMTAPVFKELEYHEFENEAILPFLPLDPTQHHTPRHGGYSRVFPVRIHPDHHDFWPRANAEVDCENEPLVAVKQLFSDDKTEFLKEETILRDLGSKNHPHLIKLLATFKKEGHYHLMFPYADANLRSYWDEQPNPDFDEPTILWSLRQMKGIAHALQVIHNFAVTIPPPNPEDANAKKHGDTKLSVRKGEELYGRHGDIKPENILWFKNDIAFQDNRGILQIADFGLGRFHGRDSRSRIPAETVVASPTYEPPECKLQLPVSRAYDMWSLGCLYLEFITWLLKGAQKIEDFSDFRGRIAVSTQIDEDNFFTIVRDNGTQEAVVNEKVCEWVEDLHANEKCSQLIHDLLECTMDDLLIIDAKERLKARWLHQKLLGFLKQAETDQEYMLTPVPRQPRQTRSNSSPEVFQKPKNKTKLRKATNHTGGPSTSIQTFQKTISNIPDLVQRHKKTPARTWPSGRPD